MSFQHFRLGELAMTHPLPPHLMQHKGTTNNINGAPPDSAVQFASPVQNHSSTFPTNQPNSHTSSPPPSSKQPYGSGDADDGYTLVFPDIDAFQAWRAQEEETQMVEFVKGDTHGSKAVPPRFKDHTKLVCARHSRSGRKKYVKKYPDRVRKVPSRKLEGQGCPASISYKTYFDTEEVRACYMSQHSHEIGLANLPFTRRGRKAALQQEKERARNKQHQQHPQNQQTKVTDPVLVPSPQSTPDPTPVQHPTESYASSIPLIAPLPSQAMYAQPSALSYQQPQPGYQSMQPDSNAVQQDRWNNMATLFNSIREHARTFAYPSVSVAALETVLIRLYLESPVSMGAQPTMSGVMHHGVTAQQGTSPRAGPSAVHQASHEAGSAGMPTS